MSDPNQNNLLPTFIGFIGAIIGGLLSYLGVYQVHKIQLKNEQKNVANAIYIDLINIYESSRFSKYYDEHKNDNLEPGYLSLDEIDDLPTKLYDEKTLLYFALKKDITKLKFNLSLEIYSFYYDLFLADEYRIYVWNQINTMKRYSNTESNKALLKITLKKANKMRFLIIKCGNRIPEIRNEMKKIYKL